MKRFFHSNLPQAHKTYHISRCKKRIPAISETLPKSCPRDTPAQNDTRSTEPFVVIRALLEVFLLYRHSSQFLHIEDLLHEIPLYTNDPIERFDNLDILTLVCFAWYGKVHKSQHLAELLSKIIRKCESHLQLGHRECCSESELSSSFSDEDHHNVPMISRPASTTPHSSADDEDHSSHRSLSKSTSELSLSSNISTEETRFFHLILMMCHLFHGDMLREMSHIEQALDAYTKALRLEPDFSIVHLKLGILNQMHDSTLAMENYDQCIALQDEQQEFPHAFLNRGLLHVGNGNHELALHDFDRAIQIANETHSELLHDIYFHRASLHASLSQAEVALADYSTTIQLNASHAQSYINRGLLRFETLHDYEGALQDFTQAIEIEPSSLAFIYRGDLNRIHFRALGAALEDYNKGVELLSTDAKSRASILVSRALVHDLLQDAQSCIGDLNESLELDPTNEETYLIRSTFHFQHQNWVASLEDVNHVLSLNAHNAEALLKRSEIQEFVFGNFEEALKDVVLLLELQAPPNSHLMMRRDFLQANVHMMQQHSALVAQLQQIVC